MITPEQVRPKTLSEVIGQDKSTIKMWADTWNEAIPEKKGVLVYGPPGTGKTTTAYALANDMNWNIVEVNTSLDVSSSKQLKNIVGHACLDTPIEGGKTLVLFEEVDGLGKKVMRDMFNMIESSRNPCFVTCNNLYAVKRKVPSLTDSCIAINYRRLTKKQIRSIIDRIADEYNIEISEYIDDIIEKADGDVRFAINSMDSTEPVTKDVKEDIFKTIHDIFAGGWTGESDEDPETIFKWIQGNIYDFYDDIYGEHPAEYIRILDNISSHLNRRKGTDGKLAYVYWSYMSTMYKLLPPHQKSKMIEYPRGDVYWKRGITFSTPPIHNPQQFRARFNKMIDDGADEDDVIEALRIPTIAGYTHSGNLKAFKSYKLGMKTIHDTWYDSVATKWLSQDESEEPDDDDSDDETTPPNEKRKPAQPKPQIPDNVVVEVKQPQKTLFDF